MNFSPVEHYNYRKKDIDMLVIHATPSTDIIGSFNRYEVSAHYVMDLEGVITQCVPDHLRAWHAGASFWRQHDGDINSNSIGIEIHSPSMGQEPYNEAQIESLLEFCKTKIKEHNISPYMVVGHSDIAPNRKPDPGIEFPWKRFADEGVGLWYNLADAKKIGNISTKDALNLIGYDTRTDDMTAASAYAFMRHYIPHRVYVPEHKLDVISQVYPKDLESQKILLNDKVLNVIARAVAFKVQETIRREHTQNKEDVFALTISPFQDISQEQKELYI